MERLTIKNSDGTYSQPTHTTFEKMFYKLAEFEDFLEQEDFTGLEDLKAYIKHMNLLRRDKELEDRWQKLKDWALYMCYFELADKMQELENGRDINVPSKNAHYTEQKSAKDAH